MISVTSDVWMDRALVSDTGSQTGPDGQWRERARNCMAGRNSILSKSDKIYWPVNEEITHTEYHNVSNPTKINICENWPKLHSKLPSSLGGWIIIELRGVDRENQLEIIAARIHIQVSPPDLTNKKILPFLISLNLFSWEEESESLTLLWIKLCRSRSLSKTLESRSWRAGNWLTWRNKRAPK